MKNTKSKIILLVAVLLGVVVATPTNADTPAKTLVIIDSGINTELPWVKQALVEEACFIENGRCPNGLQTMFGSGSANLSPATVTDKALSHGTQMASVAVKVNPNVKFVFIRIVGVTAKGTASTYTTKAVTQALAWVSDNSTRLNVGAVSVSLGRTYTLTACPIESPLQALIVKLASAQVPVVVSVGNGSNPKRVNYPACIPEVIAVGATETPYAMKGVVGWVNPVMSISNGGSDLDLYTLGKFVSSDISGVESLTLGSSNATVAFATRLTSLLSSGKGLIAVMTDVQATYTKAYRSLKDFTTNYYSLDK